MKLSVMLDKHYEARANGLAASFGDGYLMQKVSVFRNIREKTLSLGYSYSDKPDAAYQSLPMSQLENILESKVVPYTDNVTALSTLCKKAGDLDWDHVVDNLKPNFVFHESCHAVARSESQKVKATDLPARLTVLLIEESFANACEFFAIADAADLATRNFLEVNSYFTAFEDRTNLEKAISRFGRTEMFKVILLCYVHANFLNEKLSDQDFKKLLHVLNLKNLENSAVKSLLKNCFNLNLRFRYTTTEMYLRVNGIRTPVEQALDFDYLQLVQSHAPLLNLINSLSETAGASHAR